MKILKLLVFLLVVFSLPFLISLLKNFKPVKDAQANYSINYDYSNSGWGTGNSISVPMDFGTSTGNNTIVVWAHRETDNQASCSITTATYNGVNLIPIDKGHVQQDGKYTCMEMFYISSSEFMTKKDIFIRWAGSGSEVSVAGMVLYGAEFWESPFPESKKVERTNLSSDLTNSLKTVTEKALIVGAVASGGTVAPVATNHTRKIGISLNSSSLSAGYKRTVVGGSTESMSWTGIENRGISIMAAFRSRIVSDGNVRGAIWNDHFGWTYFGFTDSPGWDFIETVTVLENTGDSHDNFPLLVKMGPNDPDLLISRSDCHDVVFGEPGRVYEFQYVKKNCSNGELLAWVNDDIYEDKAFHVYYNNPYADIDLSTRSVWNDDYVGVWELNQDGHDSKGTNSIKTTGAVYAAGKVMEAINFDGTGYGETASNASLNQIDSTITLEAWINPSGNGIIAQRSDSAGNPYYKLWTSGGNTVNWLVKTSGGQRTVSTPLTFGTWSHIAGTYDGSNVRIYKNGSDAGSSALAGSFADDPGNRGITFGAGWNGTAFADFYRGSIDEVRLSKVSRSQAWLSSAYKNMENPGGFSIIDNKQDRTYTYPIQHGVDFNDNEGYFYGYAWNAFLGWIRFTYDSSDPPPDYAFAANCPSKYCGDGTPDCWNCVNFNDKKIYGWAKVLKLGDEGWIRFDHGQADAAYVQVPEIGRPIMKGTAWNGSTESAGMGWLCLNPESCAMGGNFGIEIRNWNDPPEVVEGSMSTGEIDYCNNPSLSITLEWDFSDPEGEPQAGFEIIIIDKYNNEVINTIVYSSNTYFNGFTAEYNQDYTWDLRVMDDVDQWSATTSITFSTPKHRPPSVEIVKCFPEEPSEGEEVNCFASTTAYTSLPAPNDKVENSLCYVEGSPINEGECSYLWSVSPVEGGTTVDKEGNDTNNAVTPIIRFLDDSIVPVTVKLDVTDELGTTCSATKVFGSIKVKLPVWIETR